MWIQSELFHLLDVEVHLSDDRFALALYVQQSDQLFAKILGDSVL